MTDGVDGTVCVFAFERGACGWSDATRCDEHFNLSEVSALRHARVNFLRYPRRR